LVAVSFGGDCHLACHLKFETCGNFGALNKSNLTEEIMKNTLGILLAAIFAILSLFHVYWAAGGRFGSAVAVPTVGGEHIFNPSAFATLLVAAALLMAMLTILGQIGLLGETIPQWIFRWATFGIAALFLLRAIGDFKLVGFFKQVNETGFAFWDSFLFSPLCLFIAIAAFLIGYEK
jgi:Protein of unknown function (DUF3995)